MRSEFRSTVVRGKTSLRRRDGVVRSFPIQCQCNVDAAPQAPTFRHSPSRSLPPDWGCVCSFAVPWGATLLVLLVDDVAVVVGQLFVNRLLVQRFCLFLACDRPNGRWLMLCSASR